MQSLFANTRTSRISRTDAIDSAATQATGAAPAEAGQTDGPQVLSMHELLLVSGGDGDATALPVTKW